MGGTVESISPSSEELARRVSDGDEEAVIELWERHRERSWKVAVSAGSDAHEAEDAVAEAFWRVIRRAQKGHDFERFGPYLYQSVRNEVRARHRKFGREITQDDVDRTANYDAAGYTPMDLLDGETQLLSAAVQSMSERDRTVVWLSEVEGYKPAEIAEVLGISANNAAQLVVRSKRRLRKAWVEELAGGRGCGFSLETLTAFALDELDGDERIDVEAHLLACDVCTDIVDELQSTRSRLPLIILPLPEAMRRWLLPPAPAAGAGLALLVGSVIAAIVFLGGVGFAILNFGGDSGSPRDPDEIAGAASPDEVDAETEQTEQTGQDEVGTDQDDDQGVTAELDLNDSPDHGGSEGPSDPITSWLPPGALSGSTTSTRDPLPTPADDDPSTSPEQSASTTTAPPVNAPSTIPTTTTPSTTTTPADDEVITHLVEPRLAYTFEGTNTAGSAISRDGSTIAYLTNDWAPNGDATNFEFIVARPTSGLRFFQQPDEVIFRQQIPGTSSVLGATFVLVSADGSTAFVNNPASMSPPAYRWQEGETSLAPASTRAYYMTSGGRLIVREYAADCTRDSPVYNADDDVLRAPWCLAFEPGMVAEYTEEAELRTELVSGGDPYLSRSGTFILYPSAEPMGTGTHYPVIEAIDGTGTTVLSQHPGCTPIDMTADEQRVLVYCIPTTFADDQEFTHINSRVVSIEDQATVWQIPEIEAAYMMNDDGTAVVGLSDDFRSFEDLRLNATTRRLAVTAPGTVTEAINHGGGFFHQISDDGSTAYFIDGTSVYAFDIAPDKRPTTNTDESAPASASLVAIALAATTMLTGRRLVAQRRTRRPLGRRKKFSNQVS